MRSKVSLASGRTWRPMSNSWNWVSAWVKNSVSVLMVDMR
jgi:hypothetical protein